MFRIFIGFDSREAECSDILAYSLRKHRSIPLDIRYLELRELDFDRAHDPLQSTEFTYTRFLVPHLCATRARRSSWIATCSAWATSPRWIELDMTAYALRVVQHDYRPTAATKMDGAVQTVYPRKNWSSLMLMNCASCRLWTKEVVETQTRRLPAPLPGHPRRADRRAAEDLEHARLDGRAHEADPLHQRRPLVRAVPGPPLRRGSG